MDFFFNFWLHRYYKNVTKYLKIRLFTNLISVEKNYCSVSNNQLAELLNLTTNHVSKLISSLI